MRSLAILIAAGMFAGCASSAVDVTPAYWAGQMKQIPNGAPVWPEWNKAPQKGVRIGQPSIPEMDRLEYVSFLWNDSGLYGKVFAFEFPRIQITWAAEGGRFVRALIMASEPTTAERGPSLGVIRAWRSDNEKGWQEVSPAEFHFVDRGWVMKPGQCQIEFWLSWKAMGSDGPPPGTVNLLVREKLLTLNAKARKAG